MSQILLIVLPVFLIIWFGYGLKLTGLLHERFVDDLNRLIYYAALPILLFYKIAMAGFAENFAPASLFGQAASIVFVFLFAYWYGGLRGYAPSVRGTFTQAASRGNLAYIGLAIIFSAYGEQGVAKAGVLLGFLVPAMSLLSILALLLPYWHEEQNRKIAARVRQLFCNPMFLGPGAGIVWSYLQLPMPQLLDKVLSIFTGLSLPLALLAIGGTFSFNKFYHSFRLSLSAAVLKVVVLPAVAGVMLFWLGVRGMDLGIGLVLAGAPTATVSSILAHQLRGDAALSANVVMLSTLISMLTYTAALYLLQFVGE